MVVNKYIYFVLLRIAPRASNIEAIHIIQEPDKLIPWIYYQTLILIDFERGLTEVTESVSPPKILEQ